MVEGAQVKYNLFLPINNPRHLCNIRHLNVIHLWKGYRPLLTKGASLHRLDKDDTPADARLMIPSRFSGLGAVLYNTCLNLVRVFQKDG